MEHVEIRSFFQHKGHRYLKIQLVLILHIFPRSSFKGKKISLENRVGLSASIWICKQSIPLTQKLCVPNKLVEEQLTYTFGSQNETCREALSSSSIQRIGTFRNNDSEFLACFIGPVSRQRQFVQENSFGASASHQSVGSEFLQHRNNVFPSSLVKEVFHTYSDTRMEQVEKSSFFQLKGHGYSQKQLL